MTRIKGKAIALFIRAIGEIRGFSIELLHNAFPVEFGFPEVQEEGDLKAGDVQIAEHLRDVRFVECGGHFRVGDDCAVDDEIWNKRADQLVAITNGKLSLLLDGVTTCAEFDNEGIFVKFFIQAWLEFVQHGHRRADDIPGERFVEHGEV